MAFEELYMMEPLALAAEIQVSSTKAVESKSEAIAIHVEDTKPRRREPTDGQIRSDLAWLQLNSNIQREDPAVKEIHPALRDERAEDTPQRQSDEVSESSSATAYHDVSEHDRASVRTDPTETLASAVEDVDTDSNVDPPEIPLRSLTMAEVAKHNKLHDMWLVIDNEVYDVTQFQHRHPGGPKILYGVAGKEATKKFDKYHRRAILETYKPIFRIGVVGKDDASITKKGGLFKKIGLGKKK